MTLLNSVLTVKKGLVTCVAIRRSPARSRRSLSDLVLVIRLPQNPSCPLAQYRSALCERARLPKIVTNYV
jgi:hypothetical protein